MFPHPAIMAAMRAADRWYVLRDHLDRDLWPRESWEARPVPNIIGPEAVHPLYGLGR